MAILNAKIKWINVCSWLNNGHPKISDPNPRNV